MCVSGELYILQIFYIMCRKREGLGGTTAKYVIHGGRLELDITLYIYGWVGVEGYVCFCVFLCVY